MQKISFFEPYINMIKPVNFILFSLFFLFLLSCKKDEDDPITLNAEAGLNQIVEISETVTLDGSASTGPDGFTYSWAYTGEIPESEIDFQNKNSAMPTFVPAVNGVYNFTLTISSQGSSAVDETTVIAESLVEIGGTLTQNLELKNIQPNSEIPDYIVSSDLIVPNGITLSIVEDEVVVAFDSGTGIYVQQGGTLTNVYDGQNYTFNSEFIGTAGWKGIWVENGTINLEQSLIVNAGKTAFTNQAEAAALTLSGTQTNLTSFSDNEFVDSYSYDILVTDKFPEVFRSVENNKLSYSVPIKAPITFMGFWFSEKPNITPVTYDYIHLIPGGANVMDTISNINGFSFYPNRTKFFIDGDFWARSSIGVGGGCTIYIKENSGILPDDGILSFGSENEQITFTGIDGKNWKGFASRTSRSKSFKYSRIVNAGYGYINIGGFEADEEAAMYSSFITGVRFENCEILGSKGYGYFNELKELVSEPIQSTLFEDCAKGGIGVNLASVNLVLNKNHANLFELNDGVPAVMVMEANLNPEGRLYGLGDDNYYLFDTNWEVYGDFIIEEGVHIKFNSGKYFRRGTSSVVTWFEIKGSPENPVIFDGYAGTPGSWGGFLLEGYFRINGLKIKNAGEFLLPGATEKANIVSKYNLSNYQSQYLTNSEISNSAGWGIVVEPNTYNFEFDKPEYLNTFINNDLGDIIVL